MILKEYRVREFRSIWDSGPIIVDGQTTCFVGKNEAGKTAILSALYRTNPIIESDALFEETYDYPKREVEDYRIGVEEGSREEAVVVEAQYRLEADDLTAVIAKFGPDMLKNKTFTRKTYYGAANSKSCMACDDAAARKYLATNSSLCGDLKETLSSAADWSEYETALKDAEDTEAVRELKVLVAEVQKKGLEDLVFNTLIWPSRPNFSILTNITK